MYKEIISLLEKVIEALYQKVEGFCPWCGTKDYPICGDKQGYDEVEAEEAEEWHIDHAEDCIITYLDQALVLLKEQPEPKCETCGGLRKSLEYAKACPECGCKDIVNENLLGEGSRNCRECGQDWWLDVRYAIGDKPCPDCTSQEQHYTCPKCGKTFPLFMGGEFRGHVIYCEPTEQPPTSEFIKECRETELDEWSDWRIKELCDRLYRSEASRKELLDNLKMIVALLCHPGQFVTAEDIEKAEIAIEKANVT